MEIWVFTAIAAALVIGAAFPAPELLSRYKNTLVSFNWGFGGRCEPLISSTPGTAIEPPDEIPDFPGHRFAGWALGPEDGSEIVQDFIVPDAASITYWARWIKVPQKTPTRVRVPRHAAFADRSVC